MNRLGQERSAYLRHAANQTIDWYPWSEEAFDRARREDKPVFLSSGAVWCHWCHVMAKEAFEDNETARLMNELFINVKLDRDERPDVDRRYQQAVAAMGGGSGWPLSVFLTPDKEPFYGGTYFPPEDRQGRPAFRTVLKSVSAFYKTKKEDVRSFAAKVMDVLRPDPLTSSDLNEALLQEAEKTILTTYDGIHGGFGGAPKFPMPGALEFLIHRSLVSKDASVGMAARKTLEAMAGGGVYDQLGGGFHRYSTDEAWIVPHFEKMADDNAGLLNNFIDGYMAFGDVNFRDVAIGIMNFLRRVLSDPDGGFYASQDADVTADDEGGYFTWTKEEFRNILNDDEDAVLSLHLLHEKAVMPHNPQKKVLFQSRSMDEVAAMLGKNGEEIERLIASGKEKLLRERQQRETPFIDTMLYTSLNGMLIAAILRASVVLGDQDAKSFGLRSLDRILQLRSGKGGLLHSDTVEGLLEDYVCLADALVAAYEVTGETCYYRQADDLMSTCIDKFYDRAEGGFFDTEKSILGIRRKQIEDIPHPSANACAAIVLLKLHQMIGKEEYRIVAEQTLSIFSDAAREMSIHAGAYFTALDAWFRMIKLTIEARPDSELARAALAVARRPIVIAYGEDRGRVIPCMNTVCLEPVYDIEGLRSFFANAANS